MRKLRAFPMARLRLLQITFLVATIWGFVQSEKLATQSRKLADGGATPPDAQKKCGDCPCDDPCNRPPPPPHRPVKKSPPSNNYAPPPTTGVGLQSPPNPPYLYINGPPGSVYSVSPYYSGSGRGSPVGLFPFFIGFGGILWLQAI